MRKDPGEFEELTLREVVLAAFQLQGVSGGRALAKVAKEKGLQVSFKVVDQILAETYLSTPRREVIEAFVALSGLPRRQVFAAAGSPLPLGTFASQLPVEADLLTAGQRRHVLGIIRSLVAANRAVARAEGIKLSQGRSKTRPAIPAPRPSKPADATVETVVLPDQFDPDRALEEFLPELDQPRAQLLTEQLRSIDPGLDRGPESVLPKAVCADVTRLIDEESLIARLRFRYGLPGLSDDQARQAIAAITTAFTGGQVP